MTDITTTVTTIAARTDTPQPQRHAIARLPADPTALPEPLVEPKLSPRLDHSVANIERPHPDTARDRAWPAAVKAEAAAALDVMRVGAKRIHPATLQLWARPLIAAVRNPPGDDDFDAWCVALALACQDYPEIAFTERTQRLALGEFKFFPSVADVVILLAPIERRFRARLTALRTIAEGDTAPEPRKPPEGPRPVIERDTRFAERHMGAPETSEIDAAAADAAAALSRAKQLDALRAMGVQAVPAKREAVNV